MKVLVVGSGGREHALVWKLAQSPHLKALYCAPGNAGSHRLAQAVPIAEDDIPGLCRFAREQPIDLTVVGPEIPLALGISDTFAEHGLHVFGPSQAAAQLEASKSFAKTFMLTHGIPTAGAEICETIDAAQDYIRRHGGPLVVKADGLAAGKGVTVCHTQEEALDAVHQAMVERVFGEAGDRVLLEDFLSGEEASFHALVDGERIVPLPSSQDHKRAFDHDTGTEHRRHGRLLACAGHYGGTADAHSERHRRTGGAGYGLPWNALSWRSLYGFNDRRGQSIRGRI